MRTRWSPYPDDWGRANSRGQRVDEVFREVIAVGGQVGRFEADAEEVGWDREGVRGPRWAPRWIVWRLRLR